MKTTETELFYRIALMKIPKVGAITARNLLSQHGSAENVFKANKRDLLKVPLVSSAIAAEITQQTVLRWAENELLVIEKNEIKVIFHTDAEFPTRLKQIHDCPFLLYTKGDTDFNHGRMLGIVGTRKPSKYGEKISSSIVEQLLGYNIIVVSGLAYGIDTTAHRAALQHNIPTIGVLGNGLPRIYPHENLGLSAKMIEAGGALISEYPSDQIPSREHFPMRNRIVAGMCDAILVVETQQTGGSLITAKLAAEYKRAVFAIPGRTTDSNSLGCHDLIKKQVATLCDNGEDIAQVLGWSGLDKNTVKQPQKQLFLELSPSEQCIFDILAAYPEGVLIDSISYQTAFTQGQIAAILLGLEFNGIVKLLPGKRYCLTQ
jgi:DNA processing protein